MKSDSAPNDPRSGQSLVPQAPSESRAQALAPYMATPQAPPTGEMDLWRTFQVLLRRRWLIVAIVLVGVAGAALFTLRETPLYRSGATIEIQRQETRILNGGEVGPTEVADADFLATQFALIKSDALAERVAEKLGLPSDARYARPGASREARVAQAARIVQSGISVEQVARSRVVMIGFVSPYPDEAARIATAVAENFIESTLERKVNTTAYARSFLEDRLKVTKEALEASEKKLVEYAQQYGILDLGDGNADAVGGSLDASSLRTLSAALTEAQNTRINSEQRYFEARDNSATLQTLSSPEMQDLKARRTALSAEYQQKLATFKPDFPEMVELKARLDGVARDIERERSTIVGALRADYEAAIAREASLRRRVSELSGSLQGERTDRIEYNILRRDVDTNRAQHEALLARLKEVSLAGGVTTSQVAIVDRAKRPSVPFSPDFRGALTRAFLMSLAIAVLIALTLEYLDDTVKTPSDLPAKLGLPCLGVLPKLRGKEGFLEQMREPKSSISEAFFSARTIIQYATPTGPPRSLLVTGLRAAEGKTSTAFGLALSFASLGLRVLIIDADMRRPSFAEPSWSASKGLAGLLTSTEPLSRHVLQSRSPNLLLLPSGPAPPNPAELLSSPRLRAIIAEAEQEFDMVVVDSAPVLAFADAPLLAAVCEGTAVVIQAGGVRRQAAVNAISRLVVGRANVIGAVLSKYDFKRDAYAGSYGFAYGYGRSSYEEGGRRRRRADADEARNIRVFAEVEQRPSQAPIVE